MNNLIDDIPEPRRQCPMCKTGGMLDLFNRLTFKAGTVLIVLLLSAPVTVVSQSGSRRIISIPDIPHATNEIRLYYDPYYEKLGLILTSASFIIALIAIWGKDKDERKKRAKPVTRE